MDFSVTSQEIDQLCEGDSVGLARRIMDDIVAQIQRACRVLASLGADLVIVAADHGYLFGDEISGDMKVDPPGARLSSFTGGFGLAEVALLVRCQCERVCRISALTVNWRLPHR